MKKYFRNITVYIIGVFVVTILVGGLSVFFQKETTTAKDIAPKVIRFHVLANSDSEEDQALKVKVKNEVITYMYDKLNSSNGIEESRKIILQEEEMIKKIALDKIKEEGYDYDVKIMLQQENFPEKRYGSVVLPHGEYEALRILIGKAEGHNWWCVMFPPLCFIDVTMEEFGFEETQAVLEKHLSKKDIKKIVKKENEIQFKFKIVEWFKDLTSKE